MDPRHLPPTHTRLSVPHDPAGKILTNDYANIDSGLPVDCIPIAARLYDQPRPDLGRGNGLSEGAQESTTSQFRQ